NPLRKLFLVTPEKGFRHLFAPTGQPSWGLIVSTTSYLADQRTVSFLFAYSLEVSCRDQKAHHLTLAWIRIPRSQLRCFLVT
ncbi:hypothetical protein NPIL_417161, partial [Nephila pilipes]